MSNRKVDVVLVGAGIMSATLGKLLAELDPELKIVMVERLSRVAHESSHALHNAGTGHAGYCELNYTPQEADGSVRVERALQINAAFEVSLQFWAWLVEQGQLPAPEKFINPVCHQSVVWGEADVSFLRRRYEALRRHPQFAEMEYSENPVELADWMPLVMEGRTGGVPLAATQVRHGSDVDFGFLTRKLVQALKKSPHFELQLSHTVTSLKQYGDGRWHVRVKDNHSGKTRTLDAGFVFLGAGGAVLPLLQKSGIPEARGYGGFPVSGQWLICHDPAVIRRHSSKVYGRAPLGAPPMSVPHLDTRLIDGVPWLLFGPFASLTTRFLKQGSALDLFVSLTPDNLRPMLAVARDNLDLTRYLLNEAMKKHRDRMESLRQFYAAARDEDWQLASAGQRVQIIKHCQTRGGRLEFGTEIVTARDGTLAALLGASPGASISVRAMLEVIERCFRSRIKSAEGRRQVQAMIPSYGHALEQDVELLRAVRRRTLSVLHLDRAL